MRTKNNEKRRKGRTRKRGAGPSVFTRCTIFFRQASLNAVKLVSNTHESLSVGCFESPRMAEAWNNKSVTASPSRTNEKKNRSAAATQIYTHTRVEGRDGGVPRAPHVFHLLHGPLGLLLRLALHEQIDRLHGLPLSFHVSFADRIMDRGAPSRTSTNVCMHAWRAVIVTRPAREDGPKGVRTPPFHG